MVIWMTYQTLLRVRSLISLVDMAILLVSLGLAPGCAQEGAQEKQLDMKQLRKRAAHRRRRIIYNDDGFDTRFYDTPDKFLALRLRQVADTQVDTVFYFVVS